MYYYYYIVIDVVMDLARCDSLCQCDQQRKLDFVCFMCEIVMLIMILLVYVVVLCS